MLDVGWSELLLVAIVAIVVVGPKDLPKLMRTFGFYASKIRRTAADFQRQFNEAMVESEADEVRKNIEAIRANMGTVEDFGAPLDKPLMTGAPARTALGAPPLGTKQAEEPAKRKRAPAKRATKAAKPKNAAPKTKTKTKTAAKRAVKAPAKSKAIGKAKARPRR